jgi:riboflavin biosynthesis pyrimidine reductase
MSTESGGTEGEVDLDALYAVPALLPGQAHVRSNFVCSLDGAVELDGRSGRLGGDADRTVFATLRQLCDVILVGAGTVRAENYGSFDVPAGRRKTRIDAGMAPVPPIAVVTASLDLDPAADLFSAEVRPIVLTCATAPAQRRESLREVADIHVCGYDAVDAHLALGTLVELGMSRVLTEGGPQWHTQLARAHLLDELCLTLAPLLAGPGRTGMAAGERWVAPVGFTLAHVLAADDYLFLRYRRQP